MTADQLPIPGQVDLGIIGVVKRLRECGIETFESCSRLWGGGPLSLWTVQRLHYRAGRLRRVFRFRLGGLGFLEAFSHNFLVTFLTRFWERFSLTLRIKQHKIVPHSSPKRA